MLNRTQVSETTHIYRIIASLLALCVGCEQSQTQTQIQTPQNTSKQSHENPPQTSEPLVLEGDFFGDQLLESDELGDDFLSVPCVGGTSKNLEDTRFLRGQLVAPYGKIAALDHDSLLNNVTDFLLDDAFAVPIPSEQTVAGVTVTLGKIDAQGKLESSYHEAVSDALGRFCIRKPDATDFSPSLGLLATQNGVTLRSLVLSPAHSNISISSELLTQMLIESNALDTKYMPELINLHTLADSAIDLIKPMKETEFKDSADALKVTRAHLNADPRFKSALDALKVKTKQTNN